MKGSLPVKNLFFFKNVQKNLSQKVNIAELHNPHICISVLRCIQGIFILGVKGHLGVISGFEPKNFKNFYLKN